MTVALTAKQKRLKKKHGTPHQFSKGVYAALGEVSLFEAERAIADYEREWLEAGITSPICRKCRDPLLVGGNWAKGGARRKDYICRKCSTKATKRRRHRKPGINLKACHRYWAKNRLKLSESQRKKSVALKKEVLGHYSGGVPTCANLYGQHVEPYTDIRALSLDHINGGGTQERTQGHGRSGWNLCALLKKKGFPTGFQVLCMNCQFIKREVNGEMRKHEKSKTISTVD